MNNISSVGLWWAKHSVRARAWPGGLSNMVSTFCSTLPPTSNAYDLHTEAWLHIHWILVISFFFCCGLALQLSSQKVECKEELKEGSDTTGKPKIKVEIKQEFPAKVMILL